MAGEKILIVEDEVEDHARLEALMRDCGFEVVGAARATDEAIPMALRYNPDVVLMDIRIPRKFQQHAPSGDIGPQEGVYAAEEILRSHNASIVFVTSSPPSDLLMEKVAAVSPTALFINKPFTNDQMIGSVKLAIRRRSPPKDQAPSSTKNIFVCYAHEDLDIEKEMRTFLGPMGATGMTLWDDSQLRPGDNWKNRIMTAIAEANAAVVLVSMPFMGSPFIRDFELAELLWKERERGMVVIPVFVGPVPYVLVQKTHLDQFQALNAPEDPLRGWSRFERQKDAWTPLCERLFDRLEGSTAAHLSVGPKK
jgi:DNA-binding response OmpR family regulator